MKDFRLEHSIYHEDMHENTGSLVSASGIRVAYKLHGDGKSAHRIGEHSRSSFWPGEDWEGLSFCDFSF